MKKIYINPEIKIMKIEVTRMLAASIDLEFSETPYDGSTTVESPGFDFWDDDEEIFQ